MPLSAFLAGKSPRAITRELYQEEVRGPSGGIWYDAVIRGRAVRNDGLLRNPLYAGHLLWNRTASTKDPRVGMRVRRRNAPAALVEHEVSELAIVDQSV